MRGFLGQTELLLLTDDALVEGARELPDFFEADDLDDDTRELALELCDFSLGAFSLGAFSLGALSLGAFSLGVFSLGAFSLL